MIFKKRMKKEMKEKEFEKVYKVRCKIERKDKWVRGMKRKGKRWERENWEEQYREGRKF